MRLTIQEVRVEAMKKNNSQYQTLVEDALAKKLTITRQQEQEIYQIYKEIAKDYEKRLSKVNPDSLTYRWMKDYIKSLQTEYKGAGQQIERTVKRNAKISAKLGVSPQISLLHSACDSVGIDKSFTSMLSKVPQNALKEIYSGKLYEDNISLSERIWGAVNKNNKDIQRILAKGISAKKSSFELAKDLEKYVNPDAKKEWEWRKVYPNTAKSVDYNAQRLARTAVQHAFQLAQKRSCMKNPYVQGIQWISAMKHGRTCEICKARNGKVFSVEHCPLDHPNGLCSTIPYIPKSMEKIGDELRSWIDGKSNVMLDNWLKVV